MKKKVLLSIVIMLLIIVTGCGKSNEVGNKSSKEEYKTLSETYVFSTDKNKSITMKVTAPNNEKYELTKVRPKYYKSYSGNIFLDGDKINVDYLKDEIYSYSIDRTPTQPKVEKFIDGIDIDEYKMLDRAVAEILDEPISNIVEIGL